MSTNSSIGFHYSTGSEAKCSAPSSGTGQITTAFESEVRKTTNSAALYDEARALDSWRSELYHPVVLLRAVSNLHGKGSGCQNNRCRWQRVSGLSARLRSSNQRTRTPQDSRSNQRPGRKGDDVWYSSRARSQARAQIQTNGAERGHGDLWDKRDRCHDECDKDRARGDRKGHGPQI